MAAEYFNQGKFELMTNSIDLDVDTIKVAKMDPSYTPNIDSDQYYSDISANAVGTDQTLANVTTTKNDTDDAADTDADDVSETGQTLSFNRVVYYKDTGTPSTSPLIAYADVIEGTLSPTSGDITITFPSRGLFSF